MKTRKGLVGWMFIVAFGVTALVTGPRHALAQGMGMGDLMSPPVTSEDVEKLVDMMDADEAQEEILRDLFQGLMQKHTTSSERLKEMIEKAKQEAEGDPTVWQDFQRKAIEYMKYQETLKKSLFEDMRLVLSPEQAEQWPAFERFHRRKHVLDDSQSIVTAARVDLVTVMEDVAEKQETSADSEEITDVVRRYEIELDRLLVEKKKIGDKQLEEVLEVMKGGGNMLAEMPRWEKMFNEGREIQIEIRDVNEKYMRLFAARLEPESQSEFRSEYNRRAMPVVYARNYVDEAFNTANGIESMSDEQREQIAAMEEEYEREAVGIREKWASALRDWQVEVEMMQMWGGSNSGGPEAVAQRDAKKDLDERYYERLRLVLTEEQRENLPQRETDWRNSGGFGFGD